jgi:hypothetical protein
MNIHIYTYIHTYMYIFIYVYIYIYICISLGEELKFKFRDYKDQIINKSKRRSSNDSINAKNMILNAKNFKIYSDTVNGVCRDDSSTYDKDIDKDGKYVRSGMFIYIFVYTCFYIHTYMNIYFYAYMILFIIFMHFCMCL